MADERRIRETLEWLEASDQEILNVAECLGMEGVESSDEGYRRAWVICEMTRAWERVSFQVWQALPEWSERWGAWPHCNGQAGCWMHLGRARRWCGCRCGWCRVARAVRRDGRRQECRCTVPEAVSGDYSETTWVCPHGGSWVWDDGDWFRE